MRRFLNGKPLRTARSLISNSVSGSKSTASYLASSNLEMQYAHRLPGHRQVSQVNQGGIIGHLDNEVLGDAIIH
jgi:hypothetical protein